MENDIILLVEDNQDIMKANKKFLEINHYKVNTAENVEKAKRCMEDEMPVLIVLDILLPDGSGLDLCTTLRNEYVDIPILFLSALDTNHDVIAALQAGGDDYLAKPYAYEVLLARIEALIRRSKKHVEREIGPFTIDYIAQRVYRGEQDVLLKPREFALFCLLAENPSVFFQPASLYERIWVGNSLEDVRTVYAHISSLRRKLELYGDSELDIEQKRGSGYRLITRK